MRGLHWAGLLACLAVPGVFSQPGPQPSSQAPGVSWATDCSCSTDNKTDSRLTKARDMTEAINNKTSVLSKLRHRATHSEEAVWASLSLSAVLGLLLLGVLQSRMWTQRSFISYPDSTPTKYEQHNRKSEIRVRQLIRSTGRSLLSSFNRRAKYRVPGRCTLQMESFLHMSDDTTTCSDAVDSSSLRAFLQSSEESCSSDSDDSGGGETAGLVGSGSGWRWDGKHAYTPLSARKRTASMSSDTSSSFLNSSVSRDLARLSDSDTEKARQSEEILLISVG